MLSNKYFINKKIKFQAKTDIIIIAVVLNLTKR